MRNFIFGAFIALILAGCQSTPTTDSAAPIDDKSATATTPGASTGGTTGTGVSGTSMGGSNPLRDPNSILSKRSVYFDLFVNICFGVAVLQQECAQAGRRNQW